MARDFHLLGTETATLENDVAAAVKGLNLEQCQNYCYEPYGLADSEHAYKICQSACSKAKPKPAAEAHGTRRNDLRKGSAKIVKDWYLFAPEAGQLASCQAAPLPPAEMMDMGCTAKLYNKKSGILVLDCTHLPNSGVLYFAHSFEACSQAIARIRQHTIESQEITKRAQESIRKEIE